MFNDQEVQLSPTSLNNNATNAFPFGLSFDMNQKPVPPYVELPYPVHHQPAMNNCNSSSRASGAVDSSIDDSYVNYPSAAQHLSASGGYNLSNQFNLPLRGYSLPLHDAPPLEENQCLTKFGTEVAAVIAASCKREGHEFYSQRYVTAQATALK
ncbi:hypothetical protein PSHT_06059 [Puccinia striiformis]|uniref:Uncharacterized protein n=1 Tax=Puccinia striiformis TaxID=27350 RepID=A0A2S4W8U0_9BASI|nr:hypothetical protein PSHT_06059 [Puccinia striiformis]